MKAEEIMVGDLLKYTTPSYIQVASITKKKIGYHIKPNEPRIHYVRLCEVNPISLTPEILEKNGFVLDDEWYIYTGQGINIEVAFRDDNKFVYDLSILTGSGSMDIHAKYVHELQHAIRMCNINKTIKL